jgi:hypothetical protein
MYELKWMHNIPSSSIEGALGLLNHLGWNATVQNRKEHWLLFSGDSAVFKTTSREALEAFVYGLALAYAVVPKELRERFRAVNEAEK